VARRARAVTPASLIGHATTALPGFFEAHPLRGRAGSAEGRRRSVVPPSARRSSPESAPSAARSASRRRAGSGTRTSTSNPAQSRREVGKPHSLLRVLRSRRIARAKLSIERWVSPFVFDLATEPRVHWARVARRLLCAEWRSKTIDCTSVDVGVTAALSNPSRVPDSIK
jgi:hypothetical protein